ncbi:MAG: putative RNA methyltransferase [Chloroflexota bacterium]
MPHSNHAHCPELLRCPVCHRALRREERVYHCPSGHHFDVARQGYVNLWLSGRGKRRLAGDERQMLEARRRFLEAGYYAPLSAALNHAILQSLSSLPLKRETLAILDAGCGEGYYLGALARFLAQSDTEGAYCFYGMDLSKDAARLAAGRYKQAQFFVADVNERLLFADGTVDVLINLFAPRNQSEFRRVLGEQGRLFTVIPGPDHLQGIREAYSLLEIEADKEDRLREAFDNTFRLVTRQELCFERRLDANALSDLISMTPNYWHQNDAAQGRLEEPRTSEVHFSFVLLQFAAR